MLYKQAWEELEYWVQEWNRWPEQKLYRTAESDIRDIQTKMKQLEKKWKIIPKKGKIDVREKGHKGRNAR